MTPTTWVVLLRGINVGRHKRVAMADLRVLLDSLGYGDVRTHGQSGNAILTAAGTAGQTIERRIASRISADLGLEVGVLVRKSPEFAAVVEANPFVPEGVASKELHVAFLSVQPGSDEIARLDRQSYLPDQFEMGERALYLRLPGGVMASRLPDFERLLEITVTVRNWNTVTKLGRLIS